MIVLFRCDASLNIGAGHVVRCLTLAKYLKSQGAICSFVCREFPGHTGHEVHREGFEVQFLPCIENARDSMNASDKYHHNNIWLGVSWEQDAEETIESIGFKCPNWLIVDQYGIDEKWEAKLRTHVKKIMVIDDMANRKHDCDLLLDQNLVQDIKNRYAKLVPSQCKKLLGPTFGLIRQEFKNLRLESLRKRKKPELKNLLIFMGGSDPQNDTCRALDGVLLSGRKWNQVNIVVGKAYQFLDELKKRTEANKCCKVHIQTPHMAQIMAQSDLALTGGGSVTWEKCVLGLPSLVVVQAENQKEIVGEMNRLKAMRCLGESSSLKQIDWASALDAIGLDDLEMMTQSSSVICDGTGTDRVGKALYSIG